MTRGKRIAIVLGTGVAVLALLALAQQAGLGSGHRLLGDEPPASVPQFSGLASEQQKLPPFSEYTDITAKPVFNETRLPEEKPVTGPVEGGPEQASPLNVSLAGVIITKDVQIAFVRDNATNEVHRVKVGNPLEGDQAGWKLVELKPRGAVFEGGGLGKQEVELVTDTKGATPAPGAAPPPATMAAADPNAQTQPVGVQPATTPQTQTAAQRAGLPPGEATVMANADEIRRRIEERRKQLREEAQRAMQEQEKQ